MLEESLRPVWHPFEVSHNEWKSRRWMLAGMSEERLFERLLFLVIALLACLMPVQNDTWWHLRAGDIMLETRRVLLTDVFSHTVSGQPWPNYEWLSEVVFALVYRVGGLPLLTALCAAASTASLWFVYAITPGTRLQRTLLLAGVVSGVTITWSVRPQPLSLLLLGLTLWLLQRRRWAPLPPLFLLWANLHGAVALGGVALLGMIAAYVLRQRSCPPRLAVTAALCGVATLITPLGLHYWPEIVASIGRSRANTIMEWRPPDWPPGNLAFWAAAAALPVLWVTRWNRLKSPEQWALPITALLMLLIALRSMRNISPFLMIAAPACGAFLGTPQLTVPERRPGDPRAPRVLLGAGVLAVVFMVCRHWQDPPPRMGWHPISPAAARAIESCHGPIYNRYVDGGPIIYFAPRQHVMIDSRQDPYPTWLVQADGDIEMTGEYRTLFRRLAINCAAVPPSALVATHLRRDGWTVRHIDERWTVLEAPLPKRDPRP
jgi:hypothetical protein